MAFSDLLLVVTINPKNLKMFGFIFAKANSKTEPDL